MKNSTNNNSIINVVVNGLTTSQAVSTIKSRLESVEKSAFNIAILSAYSVGITIPAYTDNKGIEYANATCDKPMTRKDLLNIIGRSKATLSRWLKAFELLLDNDVFHDFAMGKYPFSYDKIIAIFENKDILTTYSIADLMAMSITSIESLVTKPTEEEKTEEAVESSDNSKEATNATEEEKTEEATIEIATLIYNNIEYKVNKVAFEKWLSENTIIE